MGQSPNEPVAAFEKEVSKVQPIIEEKKVDKENIDDDEAVSIQRILCENPRMANFFLFWIISTATEQNPIEPEVDEKEVDKVEPNEE